MRELVLLLGLSSLLRIILVVQGGQAYWPDERLYLEVLEAWSQPRWSDVVAGILGRPDHLGFALLSAVPAGIHHAVSAASGMDATRLLMLPSLVLAHASVVAIALVYAIARRTGGEPREALLAALLMGCSTAMFYNARHLLPYDGALAIALGAVWCGLRTDRTSRSVACGALACCAFVTYNGYWLLAGTAMLVHVLFPLRDLTRPALLSAGGRAGLATAGFVAVMAALTGVQLVVGVPLLLGGMRRLASTITDGYMPEGFVVPWAYLWHGERALLLIWITAALVTIVDRGTWPDQRRRCASIWLASAACIYLALGGGSAFLHVFAVMGRGVRQVVPFLCLAAAPAILRAFDASGRRTTWITASAATLLVSTATNFWTPLTQRFPRNLDAQVKAKYGDIDHAFSIDGPGPNNARAGMRWVLTNTAHLYPPRGPRAVPRGTVALRFPHPLEFLPYQYEGFDPLERQVLRQNDISMRLIDTAAPPPVAPP